MGKIRKLLKSKTFNFNVFVAFCAALEMQLEIYANLFGPEYYPLLAFVITSVNIYLRTVTTTPLDEK